MRSKDTRSEYVANLGLTPKKSLESNVEPPRGTCAAKMWEEEYVRERRNTIIAPPSEWTLEEME